jgi:tetratricopeptide (TPR) repeat protein
VGYEKNGDPVVTCAGVSAAAMRFFNRQLRGKNLEIAAFQKEAEAWRSRYLELSERLAGAGINSKLSKDAKDLIANGKLDEAGSVLDQMLKEEEENVSQAAADHFSRAQLYELQFKPSEALPHLEQAYRYRPGEISYAFEYAQLLRDLKYYARAEPVYLELLERARARSSDADILAQREEAICLQNLGIVYEEMHQQQRAEEMDRKALEAFGQLATRDPQHSSSYEESEAGCSNELGLLYQQMDETAKSEAAY